MPQGDKGKAGRKPDYERLRSLVARGAARDPGRFYTHGKMSWGKIGSEAKGSRGLLTAIRTGTGKPETDTLIGLADLFGDDPVEWLVAGDVIKPLDSGAMDARAERFHNLSQGIPDPELEPFFSLLAAWHRPQAAASEPPSPPPEEPSE